MISLREANQILVFDQFASFAVSHIEETLKGKDTSDANTYFNFTQEKTFKEGEAFGCVLIQFCPNEKIIFDSYEKYCVVMEEFDFAPTNITHKSFIDLAAVVINSYWHDFKDKNNEERKIFFGVINKIQNIETDEGDRIVRYEDCIGIGAIFSVKTIF